MIKNNCPQIYPRLKKQFGVNWSDGLIITYYPNIYWIGGNALPPEKVVHESTHLRQQAKYGVEKWWDEYLANPVFRLEQEKEAYINEVNYIRRTVLNRQERFKLIDEIARCLSGSMYGNLVTYHEAINLLR